MVWRPRRARVIGYALAGTIMLVMIVLAVLVAPQFGILDRVGLVLIGLLIGWLLHMFARCRVVAGETGITVVNAFRTRRLDWAEVVGVSMAAGEPWPTLDLADGESMSAMGINGAERARAAAQLAELRALLHARAEAPDQ